MKKVLMNKEAYNTILEGLKILHDPVASTLGPCGKNVLIEFNNTTYITKDGAYVARSIEDIERSTNQGIRLLKMVSQKMAREVGDGTTTATIITYNLLEKLINNLKPSMLITELEETLTKEKDDLVNKLKAIAQPVRSHNDVTKVASVSTNNNLQMAELVAKAFQTLDPESPILLEEHTKLEDEFILSEGFQWDKGYISQRFMTNSNTGRSDIDNPLIFMTTDILRNAGSVIPLLRLAVGRDPVTNKEIPGRQPRPLIVVARDIRDNALATLIDNHIKGNLQVPICAIEAPGDLDTMTKYLEDLRAVVGGKVFYDHETAKMSKVKESELGSCEKAIIEHNKTTLIKDDITEQVSLKERVAMLKTEKEESNDSYEKNQLSRRIARLNGSMVHIKVGANTSVEIMERKDRYEDAIAAVRATLKNGYIPGGGVVAHMLSEKHLNAHTGYMGGYKDEVELAKGALYEALYSSIQTLYGNAGRDKDLKLVNSAGKYTGYNLAKKEKKLVNMLAEGIIEPVDILINSLEQAVSLASVVLRTATIIIYNRTV